ncbi:AAA family ATPase [Parashewanella curva]|uniref:AAA family ATPase n=1 Tax=Parashewanella curva TaxID=2338552 RepID=A0A3L8PX74_9GAMM|nr:AAA family ATPase [Parashewanella curva]RLV59048.1 AAA family ATPase [Parashewanella curva]
MYLQHFGLTELPFSLTPNTSYFVELGPHLEAMQVLQTALQMGEGFIKVVGEVGSGKTLLCRKLMNELPDDFQCAYIPNPYLTPSELNWALAAELEIEVESEVNQATLNSLIQNRLIELAAAGKTVVLVLDEAQAIPDDTLEALRLFTNLETEQRKLLRFVLFGQPELDQRLKQDKFRQLRQRISFRYELRLLTEQEVNNYIQKRLRVAGLTGASPITEKIAKSITKAARGTPRLVNILVHKALLLAYGEGKHTVTQSHIKTAVLDTDDTQWAGWRSKWVPLMIALVLLITLSTTLWLGGRP